MGGDSTCLMHSSSYASPTTTNVGNSMHSVGDSISFGRFMTESSCLDWEKWSSFSHKRYVEEAARYAQPGSVAEKKAFFEAHYKRIAARNAAALLEQQQQQQQQHHKSIDFDDDVPSHNPSSPKTDEEIARNITNLPHAYSQSEIADHKENKAPPVEDTFTKTSETQKTADTDSEFSEISQTAKPLLKSSSLNKEVSSKKRLSFSSTMNHRKASTKLPSPAKYPVLNKNIPKRREGDSLRSLLNFASTKETASCIPPAPAMPKVKVESTKIKTKTLGVTLKPPKACPTPLRTPQTHQAAEVRMLRTTPCSEKRSNSTFVGHSLVSGSKTTGPKWHILSAVSNSLIACKNKLQSPTCSTPFLLRTEERAARRKQKLEEKFNSKAEEKEQLQTMLKEKADKEIRKFRQSFCFKARPLPSFYKQNDSIISQTDKIQNLGIRKSSANNVQGINQRSPPICLSNKGGSKMKNCRSPGC